MSRGPDDLPPPRSFALEPLLVSPPTPARAALPGSGHGQPLERHPDIVDEWIAIAEGEPRHRFALLGQLLASLFHDTSEHIHRIRAPTLVVTGDRDRLIPMENSRQLATRIPGARLSILPGAGHDFPTERPGEVARLLTEFIAEVERLRQGAPASVA